MQAAAVPPTGTDVRSVNNAVITLNKQRTPHATHRIPAELHHPARHQMS